MIRNLLYLFIIGLLLPHNTQAQKRELQPSNKVQKVAFIDHSRLRREFKTLTLARETSRQKWMASKKDLDNSLQAQESQARQLLKQDSLSKGKKKALIMQESDQKKQLLLSNYQLSQKKMFQDRSALLQECERKITLAIGQVVSEGGFTEIKPLPEEKNSQKGIDITDLILKKLN